MCVCVCVTCVNISATTVHAGCVEWIAGSVAYTTSSIIVYVSISYTIQYIDIC